MFFTTTNCSQNIFCNTTPHRPAIFPESLDFRRKRAYMLPSSVVFVPASHLATRQINTSRRRECRLTPTDR